MVAGLLGACWLVLLTAAGSEAATCGPERTPAGRAFVSYSDPDDPQSWRDHETKIDAGGLRALCAETATTGSVPTGEGEAGGGGGASTWALVGGAGVVAAGSTVLALRRRPG